MNKVIDPKEKSPLNASHRCPTGIGSDESCDSVLLSRFIERQDDAAFSLLANRYAALVYSACRRNSRSDKDAEDAANECLFLFSRSASRITGSIPSWLYVVATRLAMRRLLRDRRRETTSIHALITEPIAPDPQANSEPSPDIDRILVALPEQHRTILVLHFLVGKNQEEIARELGLSRPTVSRRIRDGLALLRKTHDLHGRDILSHS